MQYINSAGIKIFCGILIQLVKRTKITIKCVSELLKSFFDFYLVPDATVYLKSIELKVTPSVLFYLFNC